MPTIISSKKPYRIGRSLTGLGLFATKKIKKGAKIIRYFGPLLDSKKKKDDAIENKYLFELTNRWTIDGSIRENVARYINHACRPNAESDVRPRKRKVFIRAIKNIEPGDEINYDYGTDYFKAYLKPIGCKCDACEKKRKKKRAEARAERAKLKAKAERKAERDAEKAAAKRAKARKAKAKVSAKAQSKAKDGAKAELKPDRKRKLDSKKASSARLTTRGPAVKRKVANKTASGTRKGNGVAERRPRSKSSAKTSAALLAANEAAAATPETSVFVAQTIPASTMDEAQQASA